MRKVLKVFLGIFVVGCLYALVCLGLILSKSQQQPANLAGYNSVLVLGSKIEPDGQPASVTKSRLDTAILAAEKSPQAKIIVTGARGADEPLTEALAMANYLENHGVSRSRIIQEDQAKNTYENIKFSKKFVTGKTLIVTSDFHIYRSMLLADRQGYTDLSSLAAPTTIRNPLEITGYYVPEVISLGRTIIFGK